jgi:hypothetical protein
MMRVMDTFPRDCGVVHRSRLINLINAVAELFGINFAIIIAEASWSQQRPRKTRYQSHLPRSETSVDQQHRALP